MKLDRLQIINSCIERLPDINIAKPFILGDNGIIEGEVKLLLKNKEELLFQVKIYSIYPLRTHDAETIKFINANLIDYNHVMGDGSICIHTYHHPDLKTKLLIDFASLNKWIENYYLTNKKDQNYEHIIVPSKAFKELQRIYLFTELQYKFQKGDFGFIEISNLAFGKYNSDYADTSIVQNFKCRGKTYCCAWNNSLKGMMLEKGNNKVGLFIFIENAPAVNNKFAFKNWLEFEPYFSPTFLKELYKVQKDYYNQNGTNMPLFIGYNTVNNQIHWQAAMLEIGKFPIQGVKVGINYYTKLVDSEIDWVLTRDCSYNYFFGRGKLSEKLVNKKVLIIGLGAIGSMVATTLTRGGIKNLHLLDYDIKEAENVCRSEYFFKSGVNNKTNDLYNILNNISPFIEVVSLGNEFSEVLNYFLKSSYKQDINKIELEKFLNDYEIIFDCTTDNDLMYALNLLNLTSEIINLSITNHANDLICGVKPNFYRFINDQLDHKLNNDLEDLYNPTGCWSPTFKASYNDINALVQFAIKNINLKYESNSSLRNFVLKTTSSDGFEIKLEQY